MKIGYGIIGSTLRFTNPPLERWNGSREHYKFLEYLLKSDRVEEVWLVSMSDWETTNEEDRLKIDPFGKIRNGAKPFKRISEILKRNPDALKEQHYKITDEYTDQIKNNMKCVKLDATFIYEKTAYQHTTMYGYVPKTKQKGDTLEFRAPMFQIFAYGSNTVSFLNSLNSPWYLLSPDAKTLKRSVLGREDTMNPPTKIISQFNRSHTWKSLKERQNPERKLTPVEAVYSGIEKIMVLGESLTPLDYSKKSDFIIIANKVTSGQESIYSDYRFKLIKNYVLDTGIKCDIYGDWPEEVKEFPQFKGKLYHKDLDQVLLNVKSTLIIPPYLGWVTSKVSEMLCAGIVPFLVPEYDNQYSIIPKDHFVRVSSGEELKEKIKVVDENDEFRSSLLAELRTSFFGNSEGRVSPQILLDILEKQTGLDFGTIVETERVHKKPLW